MVSSIPRDNEVAEPTEYVDREHTWGRYVFFSGGLSLCIFVDIFQYSMPLAFLPSVLEDRGHTPMKIATAIGIYYWTGFLGGLVITSYQVVRALYKKDVDDKNEVTRYTDVQRHIKFLIFGLAVGTATLFVQALYPTWAVHTACRFVQGFVGAFIFFYAFLLSVALFTGQQQVAAMSLASCATCLADVCGSFLGALLFDVYGQRAVFWFLALISIANQGVLFAILYMVRSVDKPKLSPPSPFGSPVPSPVLVARTPAIAEACCEGHCFAWIKPRAMAVARMKVLLKGRQFICANLLIMMAAVIKGSVEEMLPFYGDHQWGYDPLQIGQMFCTIAFSYMLAAGFVCQFWTLLGRFQIGCSSCWLLMLGISAWMSFAIATYRRDSRFLTGTLVGYGLCSGLAFTAAAQLIADVIDHERGSLKEAANGIWNLTWEAGGSVGFLLGGLIAQRYSDQVTLLLRYIIGSVIVAIGMIAIGSWPNHEGRLSSKGSKLGDSVEKSLNYGTTSAGSAA